MTREEAIKKLRQMTLPEETREILVALAPELAESEDERIINTIISFLRVTSFYSCNGCKKSEMIAWLEKQKEQHPSSKFHPGDWVVYDGPLGHGIFQVKDIVDGRYTFVDNDSTLLEEDSDKFLRPLTPKDVEGKQKPSAEEVLTKAGLKPYKDGNQWCILARDNLQEGICGFGDTIEDAFYEFLMDVLKTQQEQKPLTTEETELNSIAFLEQMGYTCIPPGKEQKPVESRKRNKPKESWLSKAKYEIEHADELLIQRQEELREIRELKNKEQKQKMEEQQ